MRDWIAQTPAAAISARIKILFRIIAGLALLLAAPAYAIVGGGTPSAEGIGRSIVTIVGSRGNFCTGALIAPQLVLTAAHCVQPGAIYKIVEYSANKQPQLQDVKNVAIHPSFNMQAMTAHRATADVALLHLEMPPKGKDAAMLGVPQLPIVAGSRFTIAGIDDPRRGRQRRDGSRRRSGRDRPAGDVADQAGRSGRAGHAGRTWRLHWRFRRTGVRGSPGWPGHCRRHQLVDRAERQRGLRGSDRRYAAHTLPRLDSADRAPMGFSNVSSAT